ncbi:MAG TPA: VOC family protein [Beijerinckiaceae bacterium]|nr:VOC family protein [Beijerinckiaceae bacterium]HVB89195.1 VOC family protein [Beijerinckiaceae bacterium]
MTAKQAPEGYEGAIPYLCVRGGAAAIEFYERAFSARTQLTLVMPDGRIGHAELTIGPARFMLSDEFPDFDTLSPLTIGGASVMVHLYVADVDAFVLQAAQAGARVLRAAEDHFYGDRAAKLEDPYGHRWYVATRKEDVSPQEMQRRVNAMFG